MNQCRLCVEGYGQDPEDGRLTQNFCTLRWETDRFDISGQQGIWCMESGVMCLKRSRASTVHRIRFSGIDSAGAEGVAPPITVSIDQRPS